MKKFAQKFKNVFSKVKNYINEKTKGPLEFLDNGKKGGMLFSVILATQFIFGGITGPILCDFNSILVFILTFVLVVLGAEIITLLVKIVIGSVKKSRIFFFVAFISLLEVNLMAVQSHLMTSSIIISGLMALAVDLFGRCIWNFIKKYKRDYRPGHAMFVLAGMIIILFGLFFRLDIYGEDRLDFYTAYNPYILNDRIYGFEKYMENGRYEVGFLTYGPEQNQAEYDIKTESYNLSPLIRKKDFGVRVLNSFSDYDFSEAPIAGAIWYPVGQKNCPTLFIVHGAHVSDVPSYMGYEYLGEYLASNGYVVVSVDENIINELGAGNDARAILLLENMKTILFESKKENSPLYEMIDIDKLAIAGHSRGGEMVATAYLFNDLDVYPDNGNVKLNYNFNISAVIAIAPTVDQYMPASHAVEIQNVNYLLIHGSNDQDVSKVMGEKQYNNVTFSGNGDDFYCKASVYIMGANHGQFNSEWGRYDLSPGTNGFLNTANFIEEEEQQYIAKAYIRTFLDSSLRERYRFKSLLIDNKYYLQYLPKTVYITNYMDSSFVRLCSFDDTVNLLSGDQKGVRVSCLGMSSWTTRPDLYGSGKEGENYGLMMSWKEGREPRLMVNMPDVDISDGYISFRMADKRTGIADDGNSLNYTVVLMDTLGNEVEAVNPKFIYPSLGLQLYKQDVMLGTYEYKHQMQTVILDPKQFTGAEDFDYEKVSRITLLFDGSVNGSVIVDDIGVESRKKIELGDDEEDEDEESEEKSDETESTESTDS